MLTVSTVTPVKSESYNLLDFPDALRFVIEGDCITKKEWDDEKTVVFMDSTLKIALQENKYQPVDLILSDGDMLGIDWYVVT